MRIEYPYSKFIEVDGAKFWIFTPFALKQALSDMFEMTPELLAVARKSGGKVEIDENSISDEALGSAVAGFRISRVAQLVFTPQCLIKWEGVEVQDEQGEWHPFEYVPEQACIDRMKDLLAGDQITAIAMFAMQQAMSGGNSKGSGGK